MLLLRKRSPKTGDEFSQYDGQEAIKIYDEELNHKNLIIQVCKVMTLNELEMIIFMHFVN